MDIKTLKILFTGMIPLGLLLIGIGAFNLYSSINNNELPKQDIPKKTSSSTNQTISKTIEIPAKVKWFDTGVDVPSDGYVVIEYKSGTWSNGGDVPLFADAKGSHAWKGLLVPNAPIRSLVGKIGDNTFYVGNYYRAKANGRLYLCINDTPNSYKDNQGSIKVIVNIEQKTTNISQSKTVVVKGTDKWKSSGIKVKKGQRVSISASGSVVWDEALPAVNPDGTFPANTVRQPSDFPFPNAGCGSLIMRIGNKKYAVGSKDTIVADSSGLIEFIVNDRLDYLFNNSGSFNVQVKID